MLSLYGELGIRDNKQRQILMHPHPKDLVNAIPSLSAHNSIYMDKYKFESVFPSKRLTC